MTEVLFYHLEQAPLDRILPELLEKSLERKWRAVVQFGSAERCEALDAHLWTYRDESFLAHEKAGSGDGRFCPVWLTTEVDNPNDAQIRFLVDGAKISQLEGYERVVIIFDGNDPDALDGARQAWKSVKASEHEATYWQQNDLGRWEKKA